MIDFDALIVLFGGPWILYRLIIFLIKKRFSIKDELLKGCFFASIVFIYGLTIFPFPFYSYNMERAPLFSHINLIPFKSIVGSLEASYVMVPIRNIMGNIILFAPLGFAIPLRFKIQKVSKVILFGFFTSLVVEIIQLFTSFRAFDVDDLLLNTVGTALGYGFFKLFIILLTMLRKASFTQKDTNGLG